MNYLLSSVRCPKTVLIRVHDVFSATVHQARTGEALPWWSFSGGGKQQSEACREHWLHLQLAGKDPYLRRSVCWNYCLEEFCCAVT